jgi:hypothetical protein
MVAIFATVCMPLHTGGSWVGEVCMSRRAHVLVLVVKGQLVSTHFTWVTDHACNLTFFRKFFFNCSVLSKLLQTHNIF